MSGIAFAASWSGAHDTRREAMAMADAAPYRAPDGTRVWAAGAGDAALVYQANQVTPESRFERQPYVDRRAGVVFAAYARIDAREELLFVLRRELSELRASTPPLEQDAPVTDVELIAAAHRKWGDEAPAHLIGDFAYVAYDPARRRLFAARDPMGLRPLYYRAEPQRLLVATEVSQILAAPGVPRDLDMGSIAGHLLQEYRDATRTAYAGVSAVPPAHAIVATPDGHKVLRTWDFDMRKTVRFRKDSDYANALRETFAAAVQDRMRSVAPVAANLSGGMDSGASVATAAWLMQQGRVTGPGLRTYSFAFEELKEADERHISNLLVEHYGLDAVDVPGDDAWPLSCYPAMAPGVGDPFTVVYTELLERVATMAQAGGSKVLMTGARGDLVVGDAVHDHLGMLFAGRFRELRADLRLYADYKKVGMRGSVRDHLLKPAVGEVRSHPLAQGVKRAIRSPKPLPPTLNPATQAPWVSGEAVAHVADYLARLPSRTEIGRPPRRQRRMLLDVHVVQKVFEWNERHLASKGIEVTDPWSDRRVAELALAMPQWAVQRFTSPKHVAREAMRGVMPESFRTGVRKIVPTPLFRRALEDRAALQVTDLLSGMASAQLGLLDEKLIRSHYEDVRQGAPDAPGFWNALTLEMWLRAHHAGL